MSFAVVIGVGNTFRRDDGVGIAVAEDIATRNLSGVRAVTAAPGSDAAGLGGLVAVLAAGAAAGYANSGST